MTVNPNHYPQALYSEILPNLFQGGTDDNDVIQIAQDSYQRRSDMPFDSIITMYAWARPADWSVQEHRYGFPDNLISDIDFTRLRRAVDLPTSSGNQEIEFSSAARQVLIDQVLSQRSSSSRTVIRQMKLSISSALSAEKMPYVITTSNSGS